MHINESQYIHANIKQFRHRCSKVIQDKFDFRPQSLWLEFMSVSSEQWMCRPEDTVDDVEIAWVQFGYQLLQQVRPLVREVFSTYYTDGVTQLEKKTQKYQ